MGADETGSNAWSMAFGSNAFGSEGLGTKAWSCADSVHVDGASAKTLAQACKDRSHASTELLSCEAHSQLVCEGTDTINALGNFICSEACSLKADSPTVGKDVEAIDSDVTAR